MIKETYYSRHKEACKKAHRERYEYLKAHHICVNCGQRDAIKGHGLCADCNDKINYYQTFVKQDSKETRQKKVKENQKRKLLRKENGLCAECGRPSNGYCLCERCRMRANLRAQKKRVRLKTNFMPGTCCKCNEPAMDGYKVCERHYNITVKNLQKAWKRAPGERERDSIDGFWKLIKAKSRQ